MAEMARGAGAVSQQNVELASRWFALWNSGDLEGFCDCLSPDIEWTTREDEPDAGVHRGIAEVRGMLGGWLESFPGLLAEPDEHIAAGDDHVVSCTHLRGHGAVSGIQVAEPYVFVLEIHAREIIRVREYRTREEGLRSVGPP